MRLMLPVFQMVRADAETVWWHMLGPSGRIVARGATPEPSLEAAHAAISHVMDSIDLFSASMRRTESLRWQWSLTLDHEPFVWGVGEQDRLDKCEQACRKFTLLAPLADIDGARELVSAGHGAPGRR